MPSIQYRRSPTSPSAYRRDRARAGRRLDGKPVPAYRAEYCRPIVNRRPSSPPSCGAMLNRDDLGSLLPDRTSLFPELPRSEIRAFSHRLELLPNDGGMDLGTVEGLGREAAIGARDHVLATDQLGKAQEPLGDELGMLDDIAGVGDDAGNKHLAFRDLDALKL